MRRARNRARPASSNSLTTVPSIATVPLVGVRSPATSESSVDLPLPDGPTRLACSPGLNRKSTSRSTSTEPPSGSA